ncbi:hypothetical protein R6Q59_027303 [Mikania micrantha]
MATMSFRSFAVVSLLMIFFIQPSISIYCDEDDCYDLLGVSQNANASEIKRAYYNHPDKNPDPESKKLFVKIANAYEILKDEVTRGQYDYAIEHPEEVFYNTARYYHAYYGHKTAIDMVKRTPAYKNKLKSLELERTGAMPSKKKGGYKIDKKMQEDLSKELELQIKGAEKPSMWGLLGVRFILLPYTLGKINKTSYSWEDSSYLTRRALGAPPDSWEYLDESTKKDLIGRRLWVTSNLESYLSEMRKESKRRRQQNLQLIMLIV